MRLGEFLRAKERISGREGERGPFSNDTQGEVVSLAIEQIRPNPYQPRRLFDEESIDELARSIKENGLLQPVVVRRRADGYELLMGERRLRACRRLGFTHVSALVREADDEDAAVLALIENLQREDLSLFEQAEGFRRLVEELNLSQVELAKALGVSQSSIANKLRLLQLDPRTRVVIEEAKLTERHARALLVFEDGDEQLQAARYIAEKGLNVRQAEEWIARTLEAAKQPKRRQRMRGVYKDARLFVNSVKSLVNQLEEAGVGVELQEEATPEYIEVRVRIRTSKGDEVDGARPRHSESEGRRG